MSWRSLSLRTLFFSVGLTCVASPAAHAQQDPATEPSVVAVSRALPAVVNINTERIVRRNVRVPMDDLFNQFFGGPVGRPRAQQQRVQSLGSGFLVNAEGLIVTNEHVVERAENLRISVTLQNGETYTAKYVTGSADSDLALIKIDTGKPVPFISLDDLSKNHLGQTVIVLGNPLGYGSSVARGILSAKNRSITVDQMEYTDLLQTDAAINPGNSGGPLIDLEGKLVGVASVKMAFTPQGVPTQGMAFAIPNETVRTRVGEFQQALNKISRNTQRGGGQSTSLARKFFGLQLQDLTNDLAGALGFGGSSASKGVVVADVDPASVADEAGLERGLVITEIGRYQVTSVQQVEELLAPLSPGSQVDFTVALAKPTPRGSGGGRQAVQFTLTVR